jgi:hypothetical protein
MFAMVVTFETSHVFRFPFILVAPWKVLARVVAAVVIHLLIPAPAAAEKERRGSRAEDKQLETKEMRQNDGYRDLYCAVRDAVENHLYRHRRGRITVPLALLPSPVLDENAVVSLSLSLSLSLPLSCSLFLSLSLPLSIFMFYSLGVDLSINKI